MTDDTDKIQDLVDKCPTGGTATVPAGTFNIDAARSINLKSNMTLNLTAGSMLAAIPNNLAKYTIVSVAKDVSNVVINGGGMIKGERYQHQGTTGEWGNGIYIEGQNVTVNQITVRECWGDGIYVQGAANVVIDKIISEYNRRQGASIIAVDGLQVRNSIFRNIGGTAPGDGIDLEADRSDQTIKNVLIERNQFYATAGSSIGIGGPNGVYKNIAVPNTNTFDHKTQPIWVSGNAGKLGEPAWATALSVFKGQSWYRWWGFPVEWHSAS